MNKKLANWCFSTELDANCKESENVYFGRNLQKIDGIQERATGLREILN